MRASKLSRITAGKLRSARSDRACRHADRQTTQEAQGFTEASVRAHFRIWADAFDASEV